MKKDIEHGMEKGIVAVKKGALVVKKKTRDVTEEGKRQYRIMSIESKVRSQMTDLGARVYSLMHARVKNPAADARVKDMVVQIRNLDAKIAALEKKSTAPARKRTAGW